MKIKAAALVILTTLTLSADQRPSPEKAGWEWRQHFVLRDTKTKSVLYEVTEIGRGDDDTDETHVLVTDVVHGRYILERLSAFADQKVSFTICDVGRKEYATAAFKLPFAAKTREGVLRESAQHVELKFVPTPLTLTTNGDWERLRQTRYLVRRTVPLNLLEAVERMRGTVFATAIGSAFYSVVGRYLVYQDGEEGFKVEMVPAPPDCDFDKSFGYPCSDRQRKRVDAGAKAGERLDRY
jgi:hypothetical protein